MKDSEEANNILGALVCMRFKEEISSICMNIDVIDMQLKKYVLERGIPVLTSHEFLDVILDSIPTIYKMHNKTSTELVKDFISFVDKIEEMKDDN